MEKFTVVFAADNKYIKHLSVSILSLLDKNRDSEFLIYIINGGIDKDLFNKLIGITAGYNCRIVNAEINDTLVNRLITGTHLKKSTYYRLYVPLFVKEPKALYLDSDIIVNGSLKEFYDTDVSDYFIGAVADLAFRGNPRLDMLETSFYFNSGVMLINVDLWRKDRLTEKVIEYVKNNPSVINFADQCGLNAVIDGRWKMLPIKYNQQTSIFEDETKWQQHCFTAEELKEAKDNPSIIHYTSGDKPWHLGNQHPYRKLYWHYQKCTPFYTNALLSIFTSSFVLRKFIIWCLPKPITRLIRRIKHLKDKGDYNYPY